MTSGAAGRRNFGCEIRDEFFGETSKEFDDVIAHFSRDFGTMTESLFARERVSCAFRDVTIVVEIGLITDEEFEMIAREALRIGYPSRKPV